MCCSLPVPRSLADTFTIPLASISKVTSIWGIPRGCLLYTSVTQADKDSVNPKLDALKEALKGTDVEAIKKAQEELQTAFYAVAERIYKEQGAAAQQAETAQTDVQGEGTNAAGGSDDNVVDADYTDAN